MANMKAMQVKKAGGDFELVEMAIPEPGTHQIRIKVEACGVCHSDSVTKEGIIPGIEYPRVPGHEVIGTIDKLGGSVSNFKEGQRVGVGWRGGHCFHCEPCRRGDFTNCQNGKITGVTHDGGYAEYMITPMDACAVVPESLDSLEAAPLLCAGITTFNALRNAGAIAGDLVAIQGIGGLGHLGIQYAKKMGFKTVAISHGKEKEELAKKLGADVYIDSTSDDPAEKLSSMGGARVILATAPNAKAISSVIGGLGNNGNLVIVGVPQDPLEVSVFLLIMGRKSITGWPSGSAIDWEDTLNFSDLTGVKTMIETFPLEKANEAYQHMMENKVRFRTVLKIA
ncbi:MAG: alcohol dehydrogenase catalytic domain-containing protein [candidate division Zixibacteria bacterium]|nr:alcohol dehydrogenase catalytic domain-containing protein [candidate division Zixibacteria bacterium]NIR68128.1 alcohol dehydrogenase catalytic domain-containing protein [candidate division Zixibacteria bacterium]NIS17792.1 alcohol dehydrogenase catalytic domain-containing protein [candidate division Zixibacteria bacterium]NIS49343.1 alcohol dehydrogenase catalytic domain-containing protein [candidate division Zixibacteria bacterium]NIT54120.1 alcohol dehydrogenase catalytic domain-containin